MVLPDSDGISRVPPYSGSRPGRGGFRIRGYHPVPHSFPAVSTIRTCPFCRSYNPKEQALWFGLFPFRSPLLRALTFLSLPAGTEMFQFPASTAASVCIQLVSNTL